MDGVFTTGVPILVVNELFDCSYVHFRDTFLAMIEVSKQFWDQFLVDDPKLIGHPMLAR